MSANRNLGALRIDLLTGLAAWTAGFEKASADLGKFVADIGGKMQKAGEAMTKAISAPLAAAAVAAVAASQTIEKAMVKIEARTGAVGQRLRDLQAATAKVATSSEFSFGISADVVTELSRVSGLAGQELEKLGLGVLEVSEKLGGEASSNARGFARLLRGFKVDVAGAEEAIGRLVLASQQSGSGFDQLSGDLDAARPILKAYGFDLARSTELMGRLGASGIEFSEVLGGLRRAMGDALEAGDLPAANLQAIVGVIQTTTDEVARATLAMRYFGERGAAPMLDAIDAGVFAFGQLRYSADEAKAALAGVRDQQDSLGEELNRLSNQLTAAIAPVGDAIVGVIRTSMPAIEGFIKEINTLAERFKALEPAQQRIILGWGGVAAAAGPLTIAAGGVAIALGNTIQVLRGLTATTVGATVGVGALRLAFVGLTSFSIGLWLGDEVRLFQEIIVEFIAWAETMMIRLHVGFSKMVRLIVLQFNVLASQLSQAAVSVSNSVGQIVSSLDSAQAKLTGYRTNLGETVQFAAAVIKPLADTQLQLAVPDEYNPDKDLARVAAELKASLELIDQDFGGAQRSNSYFAWIGDDVAKLAEALNSGLSKAIERGMKDFESLAQEAKDAGEAMKEAQDAFVRPPVPELPPVRVPALPKDVIPSLDKLEREVDGISDRMSKALDQLGKDFSATFLDLLADGRNTFDELAKSFTKMIGQIVVQTLIAEPIIASLKSAFGLPQSKGQTQPAINPNFIGPIQSRLGNVFSDGKLVPFAAGGVINGPIAFPLQDRMGIAGEAGPEAIMPLTRIGGQLGVQAQLGGGVVVNIIDQRSGGEAPQVSERAGPGGERQIQIVIRDAVKKMIGDGGLDRALGVNFGISRRPGSR